MRLGLFLLLTSSLGFAQSTAFQHARIIDGTGRVLENATLVIEGAKIVGVNVPVPKGAALVDVHDETIIPGLINAHGHLGVTRGAKASPDNYTADNVASQLQQYTRYGVTAMLSLGMNRDLIYDLRAKQQSGDFANDGATIFTAGRGIGAPGGAPPVNVPPEQVYRPATPEAARAAVREMAGHHADMIKMWIDDIRGTMPKMKPEIYRAVIEEAHKNHIRVAAHVYYEADAAALVKLDIDVIAHSIRDKDVDPSLVQTMRQKGTYYIPTLELDDSFFRYADHPELLDDLFLAPALNPDLHQMLASREWRDKTENDPATKKNRESFAIAVRNLGVIHAGGVKIAMGTDSGATPLRIQGYAEHLELRLMARSGMNAMDTLLSATRGSAAVCGSADRGVLAPGKIADFIILDANPLDDIRNTRKISAVWHNGRKIPDVAIGK